MSTVADVVAAALADFFCLQQAHPIICSTETASVKAKRANDTALVHRDQFPINKTVFLKYSERSHTHTCIESETNRVSETQITP